MSLVATQLKRDRETRDAAKAALDARLTQVRTDLEARGVGGRIADKVVEDATDVALEAVDVAETHKGVVVGTLLAIVAWIFRDPLVAWIKSVIGDTR